MIEVPLMRSTRFFEGVCSNMRHIRACDKWCAESRKSPYFSEKLNDARQRYSTHDNESMRLCKLCATDEIICYRRSLCCIRIM